MELDVSLLALLGPMAMVYFYMKLQVAPILAKSYLNEGYYLLQLRVKALLRFKQS
jgi:hypothetical protein